MKIRKDIYSCGCCDSEKSRGIKTTMNNIIKENKIEFGTGVNMKEYYKKIGGDVENFDYDVEPYFQYMKNFEVKGLLEIICDVHDVITTFDYHEFAVNFLNYKKMHWNKSVNNSDKFDSLVYDLLLCTLREIEDRGDPYKE